MSNGENRTGMTVENKAARKTGAGAAATSSAVAAPAPPIGVLLLSGSFDMANDSLICVCLAVLSISGTSHHITCHLSVRVFSLLKVMFGDLQDRAFSDYLQAALMLRVNNRNVG